MVKEKFITVLNKLKSFLKGFSLVELVVAIAIIAILAVMLAPFFIRQIERAKFMRVAEDVSTIAKKLTVYYFEYFSFPAESYWPETAGSEYGFWTGSYDLFIAYGLLPNECCWAEDAMGDKGALAICPGSNDYFVNDLLPLFPCQESMPI